MHLIAHTPTHTRAHIHTNSHIHRPTPHNPLITSHATNSVGNKSFRHLAPNKWNHLPKILLSPIVSINMFKCRIKSFLLR